MSTKPGAKAAAKGSKATTTRPAAKAPRAAAKRVPTATTAARRDSEAPTHLNLYAYQVGFGDCFLLQFCYDAEEKTRRHVLVDFGTTGTPEGDANALMLKIAEDIRDKCGDDGLDAVVATHRHADHISGFATKTNGKGSGDVIRGLKPKVVLQPWTEDLSLATHATGPVPKGLRGVAGSVRAVAALGAMHGLAEQVTTLAAKRGKSLPLGLAERLDFLGRDNTKNLPAVENLARMGKAGTAVYAHFGTDDPFKAVLPGVKTHVLGPPTPEQHPGVQKQRSTDDDQFWHFQARGAGTANLVAGNQRGPFDASYVDAKRGKLPRDARWAARHITASRGNQLLGIVTMLDKVMNNTSLILLMEVGGKRLLFPGDAQIENWSYALDQPDAQALLADVDLYKVGHHGSLNATPKSLWKAFKKRGNAARKDRMTSVLSTMADKHGSVDKRTEVPRRTLVDALKHDTHFHSTQELTGGQPYTMVRIDF